MKQNLIDTAKLIPIFLLLASFISSYLDIDYENWVLLGNATGYSLIVCMYMLFISIAYKHGFYVICAIVALMLMNITGLLITLKFIPYNSYDQTITFAYLLVCIIYFTKKWI